MKKFHSMYVMIEKFFKKLKEKSIFFIYLNLKSHLWKNNPFIFKLKFLLIFHIFRLLFGKEVYSNGLSNYGDNKSLI